MKPKNAPRPWSRFTAGFIFSCIAVVLLSVGMLSANPPDTDTIEQSPGAPPPRFFGMTHLTNDHVAHLLFANPELPGPGQNGPAIVRLEFLDSSGNILLQSGPETVTPGNMTSLELLAEELEFPPDSDEIGVRGVVTFFNPQARGIGSLQIDDSATDSSFVLFDRWATDPSLHKLEPLCTGSLRLVDGSRMGLNVYNAGDPGFPGAVLAADLVIYTITGAQKIEAKKTVNLELNQGDSLVLENLPDNFYFGTVEFQDIASRSVADGGYEYRNGPTGSHYGGYLNDCGGPSSSSSTSGGGATNSGGA